jgi:hypothetical protein
MYRPDDWDEIAFNLGFATPYQCNSNELSVFSEGIEAGADAMLESLIKDGQKVNEYAPNNTYQSLVLPVKNRTVKGTIIFIPDEEEK